MTRLVRYWIENCYEKRHTLFEGSREFNIEAGLSVLNIFNRENIKYSNLIRIPESQSSTISIHAEAVPFTPTLYSNLSF